MGAAPQATERDTLANDRVTPTDAAALLARAGATWPGMGRYLSDAHIGVGLAFDSERGVMVQRVTIVVEVKGDYQK